MKKFGTPIGAAPGVASVKVGFAIVGFSPATCRGTSRLAFAFAFAFGFAFCLARSTRETIFFVCVLPALTFWLPVGDVALPDCEPPEPPEPPSVRFGAPGFSLPSGVAVAPGPTGTEGAVGAALGAGVGMTPLSMTRAI